MKKLLLVLTLIFIISLGGNVLGLTYMFATDAFTPLNGGMDHAKAYTWGLETPWGIGEEIVSATLNFNGVYNWRAEENYLFINLRNNADLGVTAFDDPSGDFIDFFGGLDIPVATWSDPIGGYENRTDISFDLNDLGLIDELTTFSSDGNFGFSFDPDCHYYVIEKVTLMVETNSIPEPGTLILLGLGLAGAGLISRKLR